MNKRHRRMLLVYPEFFPTYWGMQYYLPPLNQTVSWLLKTKQNKRGGD